MPSEIGTELEAIEIAMVRADAPQREISKKRMAALDRHVERAGPSAPRPGTADLPRAKRLFRLVSEDEWARFFAQRPDVMHKLLGDLYVVSKAQEAKERGEGRDGRRPKYINGNFAELQTMITPQFSMDPFGIAVKALMRDMSLRGFAGKVGLDHRELSRMMRGNAKPTPYAMELIAKANKVTPHYFLEYRLGVITEAIESAARFQPAFTVRAVKFLRTGGWT